MIISIWDLTGTGASGAQVATFGGGALKSGEQTDLSLPLWGYWPSDRVELTNQVGVSIGSGFSAVAGVAQDETYIEAFTIGASPSFTQQWVIGPDPANGLVGAGYANDVEITRDGHYAVVNSDNWIHIIEFVSGSAPVLHAFDVSSFTATGSRVPSGTRPSSPNQAVDSVAVHNDVAIVTTAQEGSNLAPTRTTWVYMFDLSVSPPALVLIDEIVPPANWVPQGNDEDRPHDLEIIAYDDVERYGVVTTRHAVKAYDLTNFAPLGGQHFDATETRLYQRQVDSVEADDGRRAVVISDDNFGGNVRWKVMVFTVSGSGLTAPQTYRASSFEPQTRSHDLQVAAAANVAVVRTSFDNVIIPSLSTPPATATLLPSPNGSDAHEYIRFRSQNSNGVFSSDSVVLRPEYGDNEPLNPLMAVTIGASFDGTATTWTGRVDFIDLSTLTLSQTPILFDANNLVGCIPVDLAISTNYSEVVVRSIDMHFASGSTVEADVARFSLASPFGINTRYPGTGTCNAVDSLAAPVRGFVSFPVNKRVLSVSQEPSNTLPGLDYAHIAN